MQRALRLEMADLGGDEGSLIMGPFDPSAFTGKSYSLGQAVKKIAMWFVLYTVWQ